MASQIPVGRSNQLVSGRPWVRFPSGTQDFLCPVLVLLVKKKSSAKSSKITHSLSSCIIATKHLNRLKHNLRVLLRRSSMVCQTLKTLTTNT